MTTKDKKIYEHFFRNVLIYLRVYGWKIRWVDNSSEGYCWFGRKVIDIGIKSDNIKQLILHELSHIRTCRFCNNKHTKDFWLEFDGLMKKFLPDEDINESNKIHRQYMGSGFYRLCYAKKVKSLTWS